MANKEPQKVICPYCGRRAEFIDSKHYYSNGKSYGMMYLCRPCDATVGVHKNSANYYPLGTLANKELRELRQRCHKLFDTLWRGNMKTMSREQAYKKLADNMNLKIEEAHIALFREDDCIKFIRIWGRMNP